MKKIVIIFLAIAYTLGQVARIQYGNVAFTLLDLIVGIVVALSMVWRYGIKRQKLKFSHSEKLISGFLLAGISGLIFYSSNLTLIQIGISLLYPIRLVYYLSLFYLVRMCDSNERNVIVRTITVSGGMIVVLGFIQYTFYPALKNLYYLGWDEHLYRLFSVFLDPNFTSAFFALFILFIFELWLNSKTVLERVLYGVLVGLTLLALLLTYSRTGFIMLLVGGGIFLLSFMEKKIAVIALTICLLLFLGFANTNIEGLNPFRIASSSARITSAGEAMKIIATNPIFGVGFNAYRYAQVHMGYRMESPQFPSHADAGTDNSYLFVLATTGVVGFSFFVLLWIFVIRWAKSLANKNVFLARSLYASLYSVLIGSLFINLLFYPMIIMWLVVNSALIQNKKP